MQHHGAGSTPPGASSEAQEGQEAHLEAPAAARMDAGKGVKKDYDPAMMR
eukprot:CAMPEP_0119410394 /NCGR_PEP_ID=MMETSP1335-20130426/3431_1 /TAXON_ID=259385 /ORGANISM="Chrysoculter rhomboideus, Strain RCC1486" /LENGTH=49 /DNA_ID= /DNA_START= /DNA_END= /DNA_ORIENTATION=